jgi:predicted DNA-binding protein YlxM (UPF0122 family)
MTNDAKTDITVLNDSLDTKHRKIDVRKAYQLRVKNKLSYAEIGKFFNVTPSAVHQALQPFKDSTENPEKFQVYRDEKDRILDGVGFTILSHMTKEETLKKATLGNYAYAYDKIEMQRRLTAGESTANVNYHVMTQNLDELERELEKIDDELGS